MRMSIRIVPLFFILFQFNTEHTERIQIPRITKDPKCKMYIVHCTLERKRLKTQGSRIPYTWTFNLHVKKRREIIQTTQKVYSITEEEEQPASRRIRIGIQIPIRCIENSLLYYTLYIRDGDETVLPSESRSTLLYSTPIHSNSITIEQ